MIPGLFPFLVNDCLRRYLQSQGIMHASLHVLLIASPINVFLQWLLVWSSYSLGFIGAPIATSITNILVPLMTILYIAKIEGSECWGGWDWKEALHMRQIWTFLCLGFPGVIMLCSEWWAFEVVALAAGILGDNELAAQTIVLNTCSLFFMNPLGFSIATSTRIGYLLLITATLSELISRTLPDT
jgi:multidrug resistance protein, MATE family